MKKTGYVFGIFIIIIFALGAQGQEDKGARALELQKEAWALEYNGTAEEMEKAISLYDKALKLTPDNGYLKFLRKDCEKKLVKQLIKEGDVLIEERQWGEALEKFNKAQKFSSAPEIKQRIKRITEGKHYEQQQLSKGMAWFRNNWISIKERDIILEKEKKEQEKAQERAKVAKENLMEKIKEDEIKRKEEEEKKREAERKRREEEEKRFMKELELYMGMGKYTFDKTYAANKFDYVITFVEKRKRLISESGHEIAPDLEKVFVVIGVILINSSQEKESCSSAYFTLIDSSGSSYSSDSSTYSTFLGLESTTLYPGTKKEGVIVFQILADRDPARLIYDGYNNIIEKKITRIE